jgi:hypothetical protein
MTLEGRLLAVVQRLRWREPLRDEVARVSEYDGQSFGSEVFSIARRELHPPPERRT